jgi:hypothetical protein
MASLKRITVVLSLAAIVLVGIVFDRFVNPPDRATGSPPASPTVGSSVVAALPSDEPTPLGGTDLPTCTAADLALSVGGWQGATGSMAGGATVINVRPEPCRIAGKPGVALFGRGGAQIATGSPPQRGGAADAVELSEGDVAWVITVWSNWCRDPPMRPLSLLISLPDDGGELHATVRERATSRDEVPRCDAQTAPSSISVPKPFASNTDFEPNVEPAGCRADALEGYLGPWGAGLGNYYASAFVLNVGGIDCLLDASPPLELRDAAGNRLVRAGQRAPGARIVLPSGWVAVARIDFANWCLAEPRLPFEFELTIGSERLRLAPATSNSELGPPSCISPGATPPPVLGYESPFDVPGLSTP